MSELSRRILQRRLELGLSQEELAQRMGYRSKSSITKLEKGVNDIPQAKLEELAAALETTPAYLLGLDVPCPPPGFEPLPAMTQVPLIGSIACGTPITAEQNIERYIGVPAAWRADFALTLFPAGGALLHPFHQPEPENVLPAHKVVFGRLGIAAAGRAAQARVEHAPPVAAFSGTEIDAQRVVPPGGKSAGTIAPGGKVHIYQLHPHRRADVQLCQRVLGRELQLK